MFSLSLYMISRKFTLSLNAGHNSWKGTDKFRYLCTLIPGDEIQIQNPWETLSYNVIETKIINPDEFNEMLIQEGKDIITLFTCHPYASNGKYRYVVPRESNHKKQYYNQFFWDSLKFSGCFFLKKPKKPHFCTVCAQYRSVIISVVQCITVESLLTNLMDVWLFQDSSFKTSDYLLSNIMGSVCSVSVPGEVLTKSVICAAIHHFVGIILSYFVFRKREV